MCAIIRCDERGRERVLMKCDGEDTVRLQAELLALFYCDGKILIATGESEC